MFNRTAIPLFKIAGIRIEIDYSWFIVLVLVILTLATSYFPTEYPEWTLTQVWVAGIVTAILFFTSVLLHELGHSIVANELFDTPVERITLFIFGGAAQLEDEPPGAAAEFFIAIAGPLVSVGVGLLAWLGNQFVVAGTVIGGVLLYLMMINFILAAFNMIPGFPLDGGRVLRSIAWKVTGDLQKATRIAAGVGRIVAMLFILLGMVQLLGGFIVGGLWIAFIGWFLDSAARSELRQRLIRDLLEDHQVAEAMSDHIEAVGSAMTLQELVDNRVLRDGQRAFLVQNPGGDLAGLLTMHQIKDVPRESWVTTTAGQAAIPIEQMKRVSPQEELWDALLLMDRRGVNQLPVMVNNQIMGLLRREDVIDFMRLQREFATSA